MKTATIQEPAAEATGHETEEAIRRHLNAVLEEVDELFDILNRPRGQGRSAKAFIEGIDQIEGKCRDLRADIIVHSRARGEGLRANGKPDMRFNRNRAVIVGSAGPSKIKPLTSTGKRDLRFSKQTA